MNCLKETRAQAALAFGLLFLLAGCDALLDVEPNPDSVPADVIDDSSSLESRLAGARATFAFGYDMAIVYGGLFTDELIDATGLEAIDERRVQSSNGNIGAAGENPEGIDGLWTPLQRGIAMADRIQEDILEGNFPDQIPNSEESPELAHMSLLAGYGKLMLADLFCSTAFGGTGPEYSSQETYQLAADEFSMAIEAANVTPEVRNAALVGRARARLQMGDEAGALSDAEQVPPDFVYLIEAYSNNSQRAQNDIWNMLFDSERFSVAPAFRELTVDDTGQPDPRVDVFRNEDSPFAIDGSTPLYVPRKYSRGTAPIVLASGFQTQYIVAEIQGGQAAVDIINAVRERQGIEADFTSSNPVAIRRKLIGERRRTLFLQGQRMGDLRRYLRAYDVNLFPSGSGFGTDTCFPLPDAERENNPGL